VLTIRPLEERDFRAWDEYVVRSPGAHFGQLTAWQRLTQRTYGCPSRCWIALEQERVRGVLPLFVKRGPLGRTLFSAPGGLLADDDATAAALLEPARNAVRSEGAEYLELRDQLHRWPGLETVEEHVTMVLRLETSADAQWKRFDAKLRNQIRKGEKSGFATRWGNDLHAGFHRVLLENLRDLGTPVRGAPYFRAAAAALGDAAEIVVIEHQGRPAGAMFLARMGGRMWDPWASSLRRYFALCPNQVLYWAAIQRGIERGLDSFDMGRSQWGSGTFHFKQQWGAEPVPLYYQYVLGRARRAPTLEAQQHSFDLATRVWKRLPLAVAAPLGERVRRLFPEAL
jgi:FemAB-related protein (PEP-CTERM system-associated)